MLVFRGVEFDMLGRIKIHSFWNLVIFLRERAVKLWGVYVVLAGSSLLRAIIGAVCCIQNHLKSRINRGNDLKLPELLAMSSRILGKLKRVKLDRIGFLCILPKRMVTESKVTTICSTMGPSFKLDNISICYPILTMENTHHRCQQ